MKLVKLVKLVKLITVYFFDILTSKKGSKPAVFYTFDFELCFAPQQRALFPHPNLQKWREHVVFCTFWLRNVLRATTACTLSTSELPKVVRHWCVLYILTSKCASRHNGVHFFDIGTSKSGPTLVCFARFDFKMCFAPQRRALFRHLNFQKWSAPLVFCPFWLGNVLRATTAWTFPCLIWPAGSAPAALASLLFDPPEPQIIGKTQWIATFLSFSRIYLFFLLILSLLTLLTSAFQLSILSEVSLLNFLRWTQNLKDPQLTQVFRDWGDTICETPTMSPQVEQISGEGLKWYCPSVSKEIHRLGHKETKWDPSSLRPPQKTLQISYLLRSTKSKRPLADHKLSETLASP